MYNTYMRILGIDPGFERLGIAIIEKNKTKDLVLFSECFKTSASLEFSERLALIGEETKKIIKTKSKELSCLVLHSMVIFVLLKIF